MTNDNSPGTVAARLWSDAWRVVNTGTPVTFHYEVFVLPAHLGLRCAAHRDLGCADVATWAVTALRNAPPDRASGGVVFLALCAAHKKRWAEKSTPDASRTPYLLAGAPNLAHRSVTWWTPVVSVPVQQYVLGAPMADAPDAPDAGGGGGGAGAGGGATDSGGTASS